MEALSLPVDANKSVKPTDLVLYSTEACHLCDLAKELVMPLARSASYSISSVDVSESDELMAQYGIRIPVLHRTLDGAELNWPFDAAQLNRFLFD